MRSAPALLPLGLLAAVSACTAPTAPDRAPIAPPADLEAAAVPLTGASTDYDPLLASIGDSRFVLLGEASHGTQEFYHERARITRRLVEERDFGAMAIEGEWPASARVTRFVRGAGPDASAEAALGDFDAFPLWMWRNTEMRDLVQTLRTVNAARPAARQVGIYGLDLYSLFESAREVIRYLDAVDVNAAERARARYACLERYNGDVDAYGLAASRNPAQACAGPAAEQLAEMEDRLRAPSALADEALFSATQNARVVRNAEEFYRVLYAGVGSSWNVRDRHMIETLDALSAHLRARGQSGKVAVWAHNSHVGDARATESASRGEWNIGQLARERYGADAYLLGFTTYEGTVVAADDWGEPGRVMALRPSLPGSYGALFHDLTVPNFLLVLRGAPVADALRSSRLQRAVGVIYRPQTERGSHYLTARLADQFDAVIHIDRSRALTPLGAPATAAVSLPEHALGWAGAFSSN